MFGKILLICVLLAACICTTVVFVAALAVTNQSQAVEVAGEVPQAVVEVTVIASPTAVNTTTPTATNTATGTATNTASPTLRPVTNTAVPKTSTPKPVASKTPTKLPPQPSPTPTLPPGNVKYVKPGGEYYFDVKFVGKAEVGINVIEGNKDTVLVEIWAHDQIRGDPNDKPKGVPKYDIHAPQYDFFWKGGSGQRSDTQKTWWARVVNNGNAPITVKFTGEGVGGALTKCFSYWEWIGADHVYWTECNPDRLPDSMK